MLIMSLGEQSQKWFPTHVQATVLQASGLQPKGKNGTNDAYTIIQLGKEKYSTSVAEKTVNPVWKEEASFELPGLLLEGNPEVYSLCLTVMHRSLVGMDKFLGQRLINLNEFFENKGRKKTDWYSLESKPGKKKKERGRIEVCIQFMRNNMTASMFDLSMKEKPRSPFSKLKDKMKNRKHDSGFSDASSAVLPHSAACEAEPGSQSFPTEPQPQADAKVRRPLLSGAHKLSAAHSMSDLIGTHFRPKLDSMNSIEESGVPHRRSQSEVPGYQDDQVHGDPFTDISDGLPQKYATLPRNRNPFEGEQGQQWDRPERREKKDKVSLLERVTGKKEGRKTSNGGRSGSSGDLHTPNPFSGDPQADTNPFISSYKSSDKRQTKSDDVSSGLKKKKKDVFNTKNVVTQGRAEAYSSLSFEEVVQELIKQKEVVKKKDAHIKELEDYIDNLLVRVMEETPSILRTPYEPKKKAGKLSKK